MRLTTVLIAAACAVATQAQTQESLSIGGPIWASTKGASPAPSSGEPSFSIQPVGSGTPTNDNSPYIITDPTDPAESGSSARAPISAASGTTSSPSSSPKTMAPVESASASPTSAGSSSTGVSPSSSASVSASPSAATTSGGAASGSASKSGSASVSSGASAPSAPAGSGLRLAPVLGVVIAAAVVGGLAL